MKFPISSSLLLAAAFVASNIDAVRAAPSGRAERRDTTEQSIDAGPKVPSLKVPQCPQKGTITYTNIVPASPNQYGNNSGAKFPKTQVDLCYDKTAIQVVFMAFEETNFFFNKTYKTNDPIYEYEVMETFIAKGTSNPSTYLEFEVAPNNVTFNAFIYNPSKTRSPGQPFDTFFIQTPQTDGLTAKTTLDRAAHKWTSAVRIPLALFNTAAETAKGSQWRMNFFRTVVAPNTFPDQLLGAWSPPDQANFHVTPYFGNVEFV